MVKDSSAYTSFWDALRRRPCLTSAMTYLKGRYKKCLQHRTANEREVVLHTKPFKSIVSLRLLQINYVKLEGSFKFLPAELKWLQWKDCRMKTLPSDFNPSQLAILDLSESGIEYVWGSCTNKVCFSLIVLIILAMTARMRCWWQGNLFCV